MPSAAFLALEAGVEVNAAQFEDFKGFVNAHEIVEVVGAHAVSVAVDEVEAIEGHGHAGHVAAELGVIVHDLADGIFKIAVGHGAGGVVEGRENAVAFGEDFLVGGAGHVEGGSVFGA